MRRNSPGHRRRAGVASWSISRFLPNELLPPASLLIAWIRGRRRHLRAPTIRGSAAHHVFVETKPISVAGYVGREPVPADAALEWTDGDAGAGVRGLAISRIAAGDGGAGAIVRYTGVSVAGRAGDGDGRVPRRA